MGSTSASKDARQCRRWQLCAKKASAKQAKKQYASLSQYRRVSFRARRPHQKNTLKPPAVSLKTEHRSRKKREKEKAALFKAPKGQDVRRIWRWFSLQRKAHSRTRDQKSTSHCSVYTAPSCKFLNEAKRPGISELWFNDGRRPLLKDDDVHALRKIETAGNKTAGADDLEKALTAAKKKQNPDVVLVGEKAKPHPRTVRRYEIQMKNSEEIKEISRALNKTPTRYTAERSVRSLISWIYVNLATLGLPGLRPSKSRPVPSDDEGVQDLVKIIAGALDLSPGRISFVHRRLTINIDDMSLWFRMDKKCKAVEWRVVDAGAETNDVVRSKSAQG